MILWIDKRQTKAHVRLVVGLSRPRKEKVIACFVSRKKRKDGFFGTVYLRPNATDFTAIHELTHVAMHFIEHFTDYDGYQKLNDHEQYEYFCEACAYAIENLFKQYKENKK